MGLFRKKETYNQQMLREAGLDRVVFNEPVTPEPRPASAVLPDLNLSPREWDTTTALTVPGLLGNRVSFVTLPNSDLIVEEEEGNGDLSPFADAVEERVTPPYRAVGTRQSGDLWGVGAKRIEVAEFAFAGADALELSQSEGVTELRAGGEPADEAAPVELQRLGERTGSDFCVEAKRIDGDFWEVKVSPL